MRSAGGRPRSSRRGKRGFEFRRSRSWLFQRRPSGLDLLDGVRAPVGNPHGLVDDGDARGIVTDADRASDGLPRGGVESRDGVVKAVGDPRGAEAEGEDIRTRVWPADKAIALALNGETPNSVTAIGLLWLAAKRDILRQQWSKP